MQNLSNTDQFNGGCQHWEWQEDSAEAPLPGDDRPPPQPLNIEQGPPEDEVDEAKNQGNKEMNDDNDELEKEEDAGRRQHSQQQEE